MSRRVPLRSQEGRRLVERGPAWREHPDYYRDEPPEDEQIPWHTEMDVSEAVKRLQAFASRGPASRRVLELLTDDEWANVARVALGVDPR
jgi:hypothetical protein